SRRRHTRLVSDWSSDVCSSDLGDGVAPGGAAALAVELAREHPGLAAATAERLARAYGTDARQILAGPPGADLGGGLSEGELDWLARQEWAETVDDVLWRRTKLGLL